MSILPSSTVGRKIVMAITGQVLVLFIVFHIAGNSSLFFHKLNAYVTALYTLPWFVWGGRIVLVAAFALHTWYGSLLKLENHAAKPEPYAVTRFRKATISGRYQIWTGVAVAAFLIYHLFQFTFQTTNPSIAAETHVDALGRPDVAMMVVKSFQQISISGVYLAALVALGFHLLHGIQSSFQTWGLNNDRSLPIIERTGIATSVILFLWYIAIPASILTGLLR